jgi:hypothetical protein
LAGLNYGLNRTMTTLPLSAAKTQLRAC